MNVFGSFSSRVNWRQIPDLELSGKHDIKNDGRVIDTRYKHIDAFFKGIVDYADIRNLKKKPYWKVSKEYDFT